MLQESSLLPYASVVFEGHLLKGLSTGLVHGRVLWASLAAWETERHDLATCLEREGMSLINRLTTDFVPLKGSLCSSRFSRSESLPQALVGTGFRPPQIDRRADSSPNGLYDYMTVFPT